MQKSKSAIQRKASALNYSPNLLSVQQDLRHKFTELVPPQRHSIIPELRNLDEGERVQQGLAKQLSSYPSPEKKLRKSVSVQVLKKTEQAKKEPFKDIQYTLEEKSTQKQAPFTPPPFQDKQRSTYLDEQLSRLKKASPPRQPRRISPLSGLYRINADQQKKLFLHSQAERLQNIPTYRRNDLVERNLNQDRLSQMVSNLALKPSSQQKQYIPVKKDPKLYQTKISQLKARLERAQKFTFDSRKKAGESREELDSLLKFRDELKQEAEQAQRMYGRKSIRGVISDLRNQKESLIRQIEDLNNQHSGHIDRLRKELEEKTQFLHNKEDTLEQLNRQRTRLKDLMRDLTDQEQADHRMIRQLSFQKKRLEQELNKYRHYGHGSRAWR